MPKPVFFLLGELEVRLEDRESAFRVETDEPVLPLRHLVSSPAHNGSVVDTQGAVGDDELFIDAYDAAKALTFRAGSHRGVEREEIIAEIIKDHSVGLESGTEAKGLTSRNEPQDTLAVSLVESCLCRIHQTCDDILALRDGQTIDCQALARCLHLLGGYAWQVFLDAHGIGIGQPSALHAAPHVCICGTVGIDGES